MYSSYWWYGILIRILYFMFFPFFKASRYKQVEVVKLLLAKGANIEASTKGKFTPILYGNR
jgi:hypothetical protein